MTAWQQWRDNQRSPGCGICSSNPLLGQERGIYIFVISVTGSLLVFRTRLPETVVMERVGDLREPVDGCDRPAD